MNGNSRLSRRLLLRGAAAFGGAAAVAGLPGAEFVTPAYAQEAEKSALVIVFLRGGYNALFGNPEAFLGAGTFGVQQANVTKLGGVNDLYVENTLIGNPAATGPEANKGLSDFAKQHVASVGIRHGLSNHGGARAAHFTSGTKNSALVLAAGMGGPSSIKAANVGQQSIDGPTTPEGGVSLQSIADMQATIDALGGGSSDPSNPKRELAAKSVAAAGRMSDAYLKASPSSLATVRDGYKAAVDTLNKPAEAFDPVKLRADYGMGPAATAIADFKSKMAAAELMVRAGTNVVTVVDDGWDTHGDRTASAARNMMNTKIMPALSTFLRNAVGIPGRNVVVVIMGEFARSLPGSDHASVTSATVIGKYVKLGVSGKMDANAGLPESVAGIDGFWGYLATVLKAPPSVVQAFGGNPHPAVTGT